MGKGLLPCTLSYTDLSGLFRSPSGGVQGRGWARAGRASPAQVRTSGAESMLRCLAEESRSTLGGLTATAQASCEG